MKFMKKLLTLGLIGFAAFLVLGVIFTSRRSDTPTTNTTPVTMQPAINQPSMPAAQQPPVIKASERPKITKSVDIPPTKKPVEIPKYTVKDEQVSDVPISFEVVQKISVKRKPTRIEFDALLRHQFDKLKNRRGKGGRTPSEIYIFAYAEHRYHEKINEAWIGRLSFNSNNSDKAPNVEFSPKRIRAQFEKPKDKYGLSEVQRQEVYWKLLEAEDRAMKKAGADDNEYDAKIYDRVHKRLEQAVFDEFKIDKDIAVKIAVEGMNKGWPKPPLD